VGDTVAECDGLVVLEAMKMEHTLRANGAGTVAQVRCAPGQQVDVNDLLVAVEPA
jgi:biotin carboxyl carrier protein